MRDEQLRLGLTENQQGMRKAWKAASERTSKEDPTTSQAPQNTRKKAPSQTRNSQETARPAQEPKEYRYWTQEDSYAPVDLEDIPALDLNTAVRVSTNKHNIQAGPGDQMLDITLYSPATAAQAYLPPSHRRRILQQVEYLRDAHLDEEVSLEGIMGKRDLDRMIIVDTLKIGHITYRSARREDPELSFKVAGRGPSYDPTD